MVALIKTIFLAPDIAPDWRCVYIVHINNKQYREYHVPILSL